MCCIVRENKHTHVHVHVFIPLKMENFTVFIICLLWKFQNNKLYMYITKCICMYINTCTKWTHTLFSSIKGEKNHLKSLIKRYCECEWKVEIHVYHEMQLSSTVSPCSTVESPITHPTAREKKEELHI